MTEKLSLLTEELRNALKEDEIIKEYLAAKQAYLEDKEIVRLANEYNVQHDILETESAKENKDDQLLDSVNARLEVLYKQISESESAKNLFASEDKVNNLYNEIVSRLQSIVVPEEHHCNGSCAGCHGCD